MNKSIKEEVNQILTPSELNHEIKEYIDEAWGNNIRVEGEVSNSRNSRGNLYFSLKDEHSTISCTIWKSSYDKMNPINNGDKITVNGFLRMYMKGGSYSISVFGVKHSGLGDLHKEYIIMKKKLEDKGYFDKSKKKKIPERLKNIGIITALEGAALQDILFVLQKNNFYGNIYIKGCMVQGTQCPKTVKKAIIELNKFKTKDNNSLDLILISRGGGSMEDLFGFSDESVCEAIFKSKICTISAIGHEIDNMLSDYVADIRAPTPSIAGEIICNSQGLVYNKLIQIEQYLKSVIINELNKNINNYKNTIIQIRQKLIHPNELIMLKEKYYRELGIKLKNNLLEKLSNYKLNINELKQKLTISNPINILNKGYIMLLDKEGNNINSLEIFKNNKKMKNLKLMLKDGYLSIDLNIKEIVNN